MEEEDLYGDLINTSGDVGDGLLKGQVAELLERTAAQESQIASLTEQVEQLTGERDRLADERAVLTTNISSLFKTAQMEVERKGAEITRLRRQVMDASSQRPQSDIRRTQRATPAVHMPTGTPALLGIPEAAAVQPGQC